MFQDKDRDDGGNCGDSFKGSNQVDSDGTAFSGTFYRPLEKTSILLAEKCGVLKFLYSANLQRCVINRGDIDDPSRDLLTLGKER